MQTLGVPLTPPQDPRLLPTHLPSAWQPPLPGSVTAPPGSRGAGLGRRPLAGCSVIRDPLSLPRHPSPQHVALGPPSHRRLSVPFLLLPARPSSFRPPSITITVDYTPGPRHYVPSRASFSQRPESGEASPSARFSDVTRPRSFGCAAVMGKEPTRQYLSRERMMTPDVSELSQPKFDLVPAARKTLSAAGVTWSDLRARTQAPRGHAEPLGRVSELGPCSALQGQPRAAFREASRRSRQSRRPFLFSQGPLVQPLRRGRRIPPSHRFSGP